MINTLQGDEMATTVTEDLVLEEAESHDKEKIYCANCENCILFKQEDRNSANTYHLRVKCAANKWVKKKGDEKFYKYFTVARRKMEECDRYSPMGEAKEFLKDLKKILPIGDEAYSFLTDKPKK